jgi:rubrerythrin
VGKLSPQATRRELLGQSLRLGGLAVVSAGAPALLEAGPALAQGQEDAGIVTRAARLELVAAFVYGTMSARQELPEGLRSLSSILRDQDRDHAQKMSDALEAVGAPRPTGPTAVRDVAGMAEALAGGEKEILEFAVALEERTVGVYYRAHQRLRDAKLIQSVSTIMGADGQHLVALRRALGRTPVPHALETGAA